MRRRAGRDQRGPKPTKTRTFPAHHHISATEKESGWFSPACSWMGAHGRSWRCFPRTEPTALPVHSWMLPIQVTGTQPGRDTGHSSVLPAQHGVCQDAPHRDQIEIKSLLQSLPAVPLSPHPHLLSQLPGARGSPGREMLLSDQAGC